VVQEHHLLSDNEQVLCKQVKLISLDLASLARMIARQCSRLRFLEEGDANTKFFHLQACHRNCKNHIPSILHEGVWFSTDEAESKVIYDY
jgi:hypothetical protein